jgi:hypothetical protein
MGARLSSAWRARKAPVTLVVDMLLLVTFVARLGSRDTLTIGLGKDPKSKEISTPKRCDYPLSNGCTPSPLYS